MGMFDLYLVRGRMRMSGNRITRCFVIYAIHLVVE